MGPPGQAKAPPSLPVRLHHGLSNPITKHAVEVQVSHLAAQARLDIVQASCPSPLLRRRSARLDMGLPRLVETHFTARIVRIHHVAAEVALRRHATQARPKDSQAGAALTPNCPWVHPGRPSLPNFDALSALRAVQSRPQNPLPKRKSTVTPHRLTQIP